MTRKTTGTTRSSDPVPADVLLTLAELDIEIDNIRDDEGWALCPGPHEQRVGKRDHRASWSINLNTGAHHCFSCGWGGPFILLVKWANGWEEDEKAASWIRKHGGIEVAKAKLKGAKRFTKKQADEVAESDLVLHTDPPRWARDERDVSLVSCREFGVLWDSLNERWIFPIREPYTGKLLGWQEKGDGVFLNYPKHVEKARCLFGFDLIVKNHLKTAYLYESPIEPVRLHTYGIEGPVASYGVHVSDIQMTLLADEVDELYVCLDNDGAGREKEREIWTQHRHRFKRMWFANYAGLKGKDHGEMVPSDVEWSLNNAISSLRFRP